MDLQAYRNNRAGFSIEQLRRYDGQWIAFSEDGSRIVASAADLVQLDEFIVAAGEDPETVGLEYIDMDDSSMGGAEAL